MFKLRLGEHQFLAKGSMRRGVILHVAAMPRRCSGRSVILSGDWPPSERFIQSRRAKENGSLLNSILNYLIIIMNSKLIKHCFIIVIHSLNVLARSLTKQREDPGRRVAVRKTLLCNCSLFYWINKIHPFMTLKMH